MPFVVWGRHGRTTGWGGIHAAEQVAEGDKAMMKEKTVRAAMMTPKRKSGKFEKVDPWGSICYNEHLSRSDPATSLHRRRGRRNLLDVDVSS